MSTADCDESMPTLGSTTLGGSADPSIALTSSRSLVSSAGQRMSSDHYQLLVETAAEGMYRAHRDGRLIFCNAALARITGHPSAHELLSTCQDAPFDPYVDPFRREELIRRLELDGQAVDFESLVQTADGRVLRVNENVRGIFDQDGRIHEYHGSLIDVTARRLAEANLEYRIRLEKVITSVSTKFINLDTTDIDVGIQDSLGIVGSFLDIDHAFIVQSLIEKGSWTSSHQWLGESLTSRKPGDLTLTIAGLGWLEQQIRRLRPVVIHQLSDFPPEAPEIREYFERRGTKSLMFVPMLYSGSVVGFIGVESMREERTWNDEYRFLLRMVGEISIYALERKWTEEAIHQSEQKLSALIQETPLAMVEWDRDMRILEWNRSAERIFGHSREAMIGRSATELFPDGESRTEVEDIWGRLLAGERTNRHISECTRADGESIICEWYNTTLCDAAGNAIGAASMAEDITQRKEAEARLVQEALHDSLTGLPNRSHFVDRLQRRLRQIPFRPQSLFAVLFLDLDRFKIINDSLGHLIGDRLLIEISHRLEACVRSTDAVSRGPGEHTVARLGGDEFTILLDNLPNEETASKIADRIQEVISEPCFLDGHRVYTTVSIGVAFGGLGYSSADELLRDADIAMYEAKSQGKARHEVFDTEMRARAMARLDLEVSLRRAVERREFVVHYQPIYQWPDQKVYAVEALVRWNHPEFGIVGPNVFIELAEETSLILAIGDWVIEEACRQMRAWQDTIPNHCPSLMCVNLSGKQFKRSGLVAKVSRAIEEANLNPNSLGLEITESEIMLDARPAITTLNDLHALGIHLCIDDFGTGYSSLSYLQRFPTSTLKVDRTFVAGMESNGGNLEIVRAVISLAKNLGKRVVAEGVESAEQLRMLTELDCQLFQGNFLQPSADAETITKLLKSVNKSPQLPSSPMESWSATI